MGTSTFTGPIKAGDVLDTTGTTPGTIKNVGSVVLAQTAGITQAGSATALATRIVLPANSHILNIQVLATAAWSGASSNISIGTSATSTELVSGASLSAVGLAGLNPGTDATRTAKWENVGTSDVIIYALSANTGTGVGELVVRYIQAHDA
jgi:hypothetical protein